MPLATLELGVGTWLLLVACGALLSLDATSWPQAMVSRPIVAGTLGGALLGGAAEGFLAGAFLEVLFLRHPPFGAVRYPDAGPAGLAAGGAYAAAGVGGFYPLLVAVLAGWSVGWLGSRSVHLLRLLNGRLVGDAEALAVSPSRLVRSHRLAMRLDALRGALLTAASLVPAALAVRLAGGVPPGTTGGGAAVALAAVGVAAAAGAAARSLGAPRRGWILVAAGATAGVLALLLGVRAS